jgi:nicotinate-nucleotide adenylyltransferase
VQVMTSIKHPLILPHMRIGLLGGSFNPPHGGHVHISVEALKRLNLHAVFWLVTQGNPLKDNRALPSLAARVQQCRTILTAHPRIIATPLEQRLKTYYSYETVVSLKKRYPRTHFVWLLGADNFANFHLWKEWKTLSAQIPIAVFPRPSYTRHAQRAKAAFVLKRQPYTPAAARVFPYTLPRHWMLLNTKISTLSSTRLRQKMGI